MDLNRKESLKQSDINNNDILKVEDYAYIIDSKNKLKLEDLNKFNDDLSKYFGMQSDLSEDIVNQSTNSSTNNSLVNLNLENNSQKLMNILIEKLFPKCNLDGFLICKKLTTQYFKKNSIEKNKLEECVNYIYINKQKYAYSGVINLNKETIQNLGYILMMSYYKLPDFKIYDNKSLKSNIKKTLKDSQDALLDFFNYYSKKKIIPDNHKKTTYWDKNSQNYYIPGIFIFLINVLEKIETINIDFDINTGLSNEDIDFLAIIIYNIKYIFNNADYIKLNMLHTKLQCYIYSKYFKEYKNDLKGIYGNLKKRYLKLDYIYDKKWDFQTDFLLNEHRQILKNELLEQKKTNNNDNLMNKTKTNDISVNQTEIKSDVKSNIRPTSRNIITDFFHDLHQRLSVQINEPKLVKCNTMIEKENLQLNDEYEQLSHNNPDMIYKNLDLISNYSNIFKYILLLINSINRFNNLGKLDLIINDSYYPEFYKFFENEIFDQENKSANMAILKDFHLVDIISNKFMKISQLNIEMNSLDSVIFKKILEGIYINPSSLISLNLSFFSSDITYLQQSLYRIYNPMQQSLFKEQSWREDSELQILDNLLNNFSINLQILFHLIRYKKIQLLGFNFDIPDIIENKQKYMMVITKFIINLLLYASKKQTAIQKLIILAPKIKFHNNIFPFINQVLGNINSNNNNKIIKEFSLQVQLYQIVNIKNIISESLIVLNIGDCDIHTFRELVNYLTSFKFCINSPLSKLSISLIKSLRKLNIEMYNLLFKIFNIKIKQLKELNIYSNIIINHIKEYLYLLNIFNNNWISSCTLTLNKKSKEIYELKQCIDEKNKLKYFVPDCLEGQLFTPEDCILRRKINNDQIINKNDDLFWYLKYMFKIRYSCIDNDKTIRNESLAKFLTNNILSYIHFQKNINIKHNLEEKDCKD